MNSLQQRIPRSFSTPTNLFNRSSIRSNHSTWERKMVITQFTKNDDFHESRPPDKYRYTTMITRCCGVGRISDALQLFREMPDRDIASWNALIKGCLHCEVFRLAQCLFVKMPHRNVISWTTVMDGFARFGKIEMAEKLFLRMPWKDIAAWNSMLSGYLSNGRVADAISLFERMTCVNVITWTAIIVGLDQNGRSKEALWFFSRMLDSGVCPTSDTFASVLNACAHEMELALGKQLHSHVVKIGAFLDAFVSTSLIMLYASCKQMDSCMILREDCYKSVVSWTALITGFGSNGEYDHAVCTFYDMKKDGVMPNQSTFTSVLNSCGEMDDVFKGKEIHGMAMKLGFGSDVFVGNSLVFMYSKCGDIDDGIAVFNDLEERNLISWNTIINGCARNGRELCSLRFYKDMVRNLMEPDEVTYLGVLIACSHSKMVHMAKYFFHQLSRDQNVVVELEHYICMVDALCRSGNLEEAEEFIDNMPSKYTKDVAWLTLLSSCDAQSNANIANRAAEKIYEIEPHCGVAYVLLSNTYASLGRWDDVHKTRLMMKRNGLSKTPGFSGLF